MAFPVFSLFGVVFILVFLAILGFILYAIIHGIMSWNRNNHSPVMTMRARVVTKRISVSGSSSDSATNTTYFVTFQADSGDRYEFRVKGTEYGHLTEGDAGGLTFQGTRYLGFTRDR